LNKGFSRFNWSGIITVKCISHKQTCWKLKYLALNAVVQLPETEKDKNTNPAQWVQLSTAYRDERQFVWWYLVLLVSLLKYISVSYTSPWGFTITVDLRIAKNCERVPHYHNTKGITCACFLLNVVQESGNSWFRIIIKIYENITIHHLSEFIKLISYSSP